jgi:hypothetical protein
MPSREKETVPVNASPLSTYFNSLYISISEFPQCHCSEIQEMNTFYINIYCPFIAGLLFRYVSSNIRENLLLINTTSSPGLKHRTVVRVCYLYSFTLHAEILLFLVPSSTKLSYRAIGATCTGTQTQKEFSSIWSYSCNHLVETNNSNLGAFRVSCLASELEKPPAPGFKLRIISEY